MYILILIFPLVSFLILGFFGRVIGRSGATVLSTSLIGVSAGLSFLSFYEIGVGGSAVQITLPLWLSAGAFCLPWGLLFDSITVVHACCCSYNIFFRSFVLLQLHGPGSVFSSFYVLLVSLYIFYVVFGYK
jgi:NADH:ubiquinone oxidoreductase subunit 5 (subunit L)/multisubunit Na+/H+ antiporter MnhA subunit